MELIVINAENTKTPFSLLTFHCDENDPPVSSSQTVNQEMSCGKQEFRIQISFSELGVWWYEDRRNLYSHTHTLTHAYVRLTNTRYFLFKVDGWKILGSKKTVSQKLGNKIDIILFCAK